MSRQGRGRHPSGQCSPILYQNAEHTVTLIDIPTAIAVAQGRSDTLLSTPPLEAPMQSNQDHQRNLGIHKEHEAASGVQHAEYKALIEQALCQIHLHVPGQWCALRKVASQDGHGESMEEKERDLDSRLRQWAKLNESKRDDVALDLQKMMASLSEAGTTVSQGWSMSYRSATSGAAQPWTGSFHNPEAVSLDMTVFKEGNNTPDVVPPSDAAYRFTIPPRSTLFLSDSTHSDAFRAAFREATDEYTLPRHFDLVVLDPPWPNRSAKRKGAYEQIGGMPYVKRLLLKMDLDHYFEHNATVGIWITNKAALREHVLGPGGLFEMWNVGLVEEWVWIKTTCRGEPMFAMDHGLRKPYELFLLGRAAPNAWTTMRHAPHIKRRVIAAVPDLHSRKPCLKALLEQEGFMPDPSDYSALEVFARYLVAGWTSWGNEVLKYNWDRYWVVPGTSEMPLSNDHVLPIRLA
ncbi:hypothetical protein ACEQ8H_006912 [Pleosporales sp. CAS-2024a]